MNRGNTQDREVEEFLCKVDRALYAAKAAGRNCTLAAGV
jgi:GGDEF domain-containing protein